MQISSVDQAYLWQLYTQAKSQLTSTAVQTQENSETDSVAISDISQQMVNMPPPPHEMDFESMSDDELKEYLQQMYEITGSLPGGQMGTVDELSEDDLANVRSILVDMSQSGPIHDMLSSEKASQYSADDFKTLLTMFMMTLQSSMSLTGDSSSTSSSSDLLLSDSSSETDLLMQMILERMMSSLVSTDDTDTAQSKTTYEQQAVEAYEQNSLLL